MVDLQICSVLYFHIPRLLLLGFACVYSKTVRCILASAFSISKQQSSAYISYVHNMCPESFYFCSILQH